MKKQLNFSEKEMEDCRKIHKEMMKLFGENLFEYNNQKTYEISFMAIALTVCAVVKSLKINKLENYLDDLVTVTKLIRDDTKDDYSSMIFEKGKKIHEG